MTGVVWFVDVSQVPQLAPPDCVCGRGDFKLKKPWLLFRRSNHSHRRPTTTVKASSATTASTEIRVCVNRTCRRQGSIETLQTLSGIAPPDVSVNSCGCLGRCGAGPNLVVLPQAAFVAHCGTPARAAQIMATVCGGDPDSWTNSLAALALRKRAHDVLEKSNDASEAESLLSQVFCEIGDGQHG